MHLIFPLNDIGAKKIASTNSKGKSKTKGHWLPGVLEITLGRDKLR